MLGRNQRILVGDIEFIKINIVQEHIATAQVVGRQVDFLTEEARLPVKPMYADELWWDIWNATENKNEPLSLRGTGAYSLSGQGELIRLSERPAVI